jgi:ribosomal protein L10
MDRLENLSKKELIEIIKILYENLIKDPVYKVFTKSFFIEFLKYILEVYKRYQNLKVDIIVCEFDENKLREVVKKLRKSDLIVKYDNLLVVLVFQTMQKDLLKIKSKLNNILNKNCCIIDINIKDSVEDILSKIENVSK